MEDWIIPFVGVLFAALGIPLALGKVPPNWVYGFRTFKTMSSSEIWYRANRAFGREFTIAGILIVVLSTAVVLTFHDRETTAFINVALLLTSIAVVAVRGFLNLRRL